MTKDLYTIFKVTTVVIENQAEHFCRAFAYAPDIEHAHIICKTLNENPPDDVHAIEFTYGRTYSFDDVPKSTADFLEVYEED